MTLKWTHNIGAMHPFGDGNGRTARALEAFMLRRAAVNNLVMVSLSNYYYDRKEEYLAALYASRTSGHDLTPFLRFALKGVAERCDAVAAAIVAHHRRTLFREFARSLFGRLRSPRRRALAERQLQVLDILLDGGPIGGSDLINQAHVHYRDLKFPWHALGRDLGNLSVLGAIAMDDGRFRVNLDWPQQFSESELLERYEKLPSAASNRHPAMAELSRLLARNSHQGAPSANSLQWPPSTYWSWLEKRARGLVRCPPTGTITVDLPPGDVGNGIPVPWRECG